MKKEYFRTFRLRLEGKDSEKIICENCVGYGLYKSAIIFSKIKKKMLVKIVGGLLCPK